jgi:hypothetical protein
MYIYAVNRVQIYKNIDKSQKIILESLVQKQNHDGLENFVLQENEIAFSRNVMNKYNLKKGDYVYVELLNVIKKYAIKFVLPANYGIIEDPMLAYGIAILGYSPEFETRMKMKYVLFSEVNFNDIPNNIRIKTDYKRDYQDFFLLFLVCLVVLYFLYFAVFGVVQILLNNLLKEDNSYQISYFYSLGLSSKSAFVLALSIPILFVFMPMTLGMAICILIFFKNSLNFYCISSLVVLSLLASTLWTVTIIKNYRFTGKLTVWKNF